MKINYGIKNILLASLFFSIINGLVKYLEDIPAIEIVFFRSIVSFIICSYSIKNLGLKVKTDHTPILFLRGLFGAIALCLYFYTIQKMPIATAVTVLYLAPIFTVIIAIFLVKEKPHQKQWPFIFLCFVGVVLVKNIDPRVSLFHFALGICAAIFAGLAYNMIRLLKGKVHHNIVIFYFPLITIPLCIPYLIFNWKTPNLLEFTLLISIGIFTQLAQIAMTKAYMSESASRISHYNYLTCVFAFFTGVLFFNEHMNTMSIIGIALVFVGIYFSTKYSFLKNTPTQ